MSLKEQVFLSNFRAICERWGVEDDAIRVDQEHRKIHIDMDLPESVADGLAVEVEEMLGAMCG